ncbi:rho guanine nucleotide exchange factor 4-like isoform X2 [Lampetra fluviatilis]
MDLTDGEAASPSTNGKAWGAADSANGEAASPSTNGKAWGAADSANGEAASPSTNGKAWGAADSANGEAASPSTNGKAWGAADSANGEAASPSTDGNAAEAKDSALTSANGSAALAAGSTNGSVAGGARVASARLRPLSRSTPVGLDHVGGRGMGSEGVLADGCPTHYHHHRDDDDDDDDDDVEEEEELDAIAAVRSGGLAAWGAPFRFSVAGAGGGEQMALRVNQEEEEEEGPAPPLGASTASPHLPPTSSPTSTTSSSTTATSSTTSSTSSASSSSTPHADEMRSRVVREIFDTEKHYVAQLGDICEGYLLQCRRRPDLFGVEQLELIFGNVEQLAAFQRNFLAALERRLVAATPHATCVGAVFLQHREGFRVYSAYCNNHHRACAELARLSQLGRYRHFLEACRLRRAMIHIPLGGFLLAPVQRLCRYPLQLAQLVKYTPPEHGDFASVSAALEAMRGVASLINERKRRLESVEHIAGWQRSIVEWQGTDVLERSSLLLHSGELVMQSASRPRPQLRVFFLFDHQLVYCKKDLLRKDLLSYRGRIHTDGLAVEDVPDGKSEELQVCVRHALRVTSGALCEPLLLSARKQSDKAQWLVAFQRETSAVADGDKELGFVLTDSQRAQAMEDALKAVQRSKPRGLTHSQSVRHRRTTHGAATPGPSSSSSSTAPSPAAALKRKPSAFWANLGKLAPFRK